MLRSKWDSIPFSLNLFMVLLLINLPTCSAPVADKAVARLVNTAARQTVQAAKGKVSGAGVVRNVGAEARTGARNFGTTARNRMAIGGMPVSPFTFGGGMSRAQYNPEIFEAFVKKAEQIFVEMVPQTVKETVNRSVLKARQVKLRAKNVYLTAKQKALHVWARVKKGMKFGLDEIPRDPNWTPMRAWQTEGVSVTNFVQMNRYLSKKFSTNFNKLAGMAQKLPAMGLLIPLAGLIKWSHTIQEWVYLLMQAHEGLNEDDIGNYADDPEHQKWAKEEAARKAAKKEKPLEEEKKHPVKDWIVNFIKDYAPDAASQMPSGLLDTSVDSVTGVKIDPTTKLKTDLKGSKIEFWVKQVVQPVFGAAIFDNSYIKPTIDSWLHYEIPREKVIAPSQDLQDARNETKDQYKDLYGREKPKGEFEEASSKDKIKLGQAFLDSQTTSYWDTIFLKNMYRGALVAKVALAQAIKEKAMEKKPSKNKTFFGKYVVRRQSHLGIQQRLMMEKTAKARSRKKREANAQDRAESQKLVDQFPEYETAEFQDYGRKLIAMMKEEKETSSLMLMFELVAELVVYGDAGQEKHKDYKNLSEDERQIAKTIAKYYENSGKSAKTLSSFFNLDRAQVDRDIVSKICTKDDIKAFEAKIALDQKKIDNMEEITDPNAEVLSVLDCVPAKDFTEEKFDVLTTENLKDILEDVQAHLQPDEGEDGLPPTQKRFFKVLQYNIYKRAREVEKLAKEKTKLDNEIKTKRDKVPKDVIQATKKKIETDDIEKIEEAAENAEEKLLTATEEFLTAIMSFNNAKLKAMRNLERKFIFAERSQAVLLSFQKAWQEGRPSIGTPAKPITPEMTAIQLKFNEHVRHYALETKTGLGMNNEILTKVTIAKIASAVGHLTQLLGDALQSVAMLGNNSDFVDVLRRINFRPTVNEDQLHSWEEYCSLTAITLGTAESTVSLDELLGLFNSVATDKKEAKKQKLKRLSATAFSENIKRKPFWDVTPSDIYSTVQKINASKSLNAGYYATYYALRWGLCEWVVKKFLTEVQKVTVKSWLKEKDGMDNKLACENDDCYSWSILNINGMLIARYLAEEILQETPNTQPIQDGKLLQIEVKKADSKSGKSAAETAPAAEEPNLFENWKSHVEPLIGKVIKHLAKEIATKIAGIKGLSTGVLKGLWKTKNNSSAYVPAGLMPSDVLKWTKSTSDAAQVFVDLFVAHFGGVLGATGGVDLTKEKTLETLEGKPYSGLMIWAPLVDENERAEASSIFEKYSRAIPMEYKDIVKQENIKPKTILEQLYGMSNPKVFEATPNSIWFKKTQKGR